MAARTLPSQTYLAECFTYDPLTGILHWKARPLHHFANAIAQRRWNSRLAGKPANAAHSSGYRRVCISYQPCMVHRVIYKLTTGQEPPDEIDHQDNDRSDNRQGLTRPATHAQNSRNSKRHKDNKSGFKGVTFDARGRGNYCAYIRINGKNKNLGTFKNPELAHEAYCAAARAHFGEFFNTG